jgi:large subunit ribosomal protein L20
MPRARGRVPAHARHRKVIKAAKGFYGRRKNTFRTAQAAVVKAGVNAYKGRKKKKRDFRSLWIQRINAACRVIDEGFTYSRFIAGLTKAGVTVDRKVMADLAMHEPAAFGALVEKAKAALA